MTTRDHIDKANFDDSTPPWVDFYQYVNGAWLAANPVPAEYPAWGAAYEVHVRNEQILHDLLEQAADEDGSEGSPTRMVGDYFAAGMDTETIIAADIEPLRPLLDLISSIEDMAGIRECLIALQGAGVTAFHALGVSPDFEEPDRYLVYVGQGGLGLPERDYYLREDERSQALVAAYVNHVTAQLENADRGGREDAEAILDLERRLAEASLPAEKLRDLKLTLNRHEVDRLDEVMPDLGLAGYLRSLGVTGSSVNVDHPPFFETLDQVISATPIEVMRSYMTFHLIRAFASSLPPRFEDEAFDFYNRKIGGQQQPRERWMRILSAASSDIGEQVAKLYVDTAFSPGAKERCEEMVDSLIAAMSRAIEGLAWMTAATKRAASAKVESFTYKIGYPDKWRDYSGLDIDRVSYAGNRMRSARWELARNIARLEEPVDRGEWAIPAHVVNAYYNPLWNEVVFPAGILQPPFFYPDADEAVNYGAIGTVIGHEITHGFDDNGSQFDEAGRRRNWWTDEDRKEFEERAEMLVGQFAAYSVGDDQKVNGRLTLGENIADLGGVKIAFDALMHSSSGDQPELGGFTPAQRFFVSYASIWRMNYTDEYLRMLTNVDVHSPNRFRANGPLSNFAPFAQAFTIDPGTPMRRADGEIAEIW